MTALRCTSSDLSKLASESFVFKVAAQAGRWRGWKGGHGNHTPVAEVTFYVMSSTECPWKCPSRWTQSNPRVPASTSREYWDDWSLAKGHFPLMSAGAGLGASKEHPVSPVPAVCRAGTAPNIPQILGGILLLYSPN